MQQQEIVINEEKKQTEVLTDLFNDAPFGLYKVNDSYHLTCGKYRKEISEEELNKIVEFVNNTNWETIGMYITAINETIKELNTNI